MGKCPFCNGEVNGDLLLFGGPCPHCFNTIPGEEAATDPGARLRAAEAKVVAASNRKQQLLSAAIVLLMLVGAGFGYKWWADKKAAEEAILYVEFDADFDIFTLSPDELKELYPDEEPEQVTDNTSGGSKGRTKPPKEATMRPPSGGGEPVAEGPDFGMFENQGDDAATTPKSSGNDLSTDLSSGGGLAELGGPTLGRSTVTLRSDAEIKKHIGLVMKRNARQVTACYESVLKKNESFAGTFSLNFTVGKDGTTSKVSVTGQGVDPEFERCMVSRVQGWTFSNLAKEAPVKYPLKLSPDQGF